MPVIQSQARAANCLSTTSEVRSQVGEALYISHRESRTVGTIFETFLQRINAPAHLA
jgi:hypothetical protein